jgi:hypothetical protein
VPFVPFVPFVGDMCWSIGKPYGVGKGKEPKDRNELRRPGEGVKQERPFLAGHEVVTVGEDALEGQGDWRCSRIPEPEWVHCRMLCPRIEVHLPESRSRQTTRTVLD